MAHHTKDDAETILFNISAVERETGLTKDTLRVWERRYGFPHPVRDDNGDRAYTTQQITKLRLIKRLLDQGHRPGKIIGLANIPRGQTPGTYALRLEDQEFDWIAFEQTANGFWQEIGGPLSAGTEGGFGDGAFNPEAGPFKVVVVFENSTWGTGGTLYVDDLFFTGGYTLLFRSGAAHLFNYGFGTDYMVSDRIGLRSELRDHIWSDSHLWGVRFAVVRRLER